MCVRIPKHYIIRCITFILALQLLNMSIYTQEFCPIYNEAGSDETNINETFVEYVVEVVLGHTNAIAEQKQHHKDLHFHKHISFQTLTVSKPIVRSDAQLNCAKMPIPLHEAFDDNYLQRIDPQPPKA